MQGRARGGYGTRRCCLCMGVGRRPVGCREGRLGSRGRGCRRRCRLHRGGPLRRLLCRVLPRSRSHCAPVCGSDFGGCPCLLRGWGAV